MKIFQILCLIVILIGHVTRILNRLYNSYNYELYGLWECVFGSVVLDVKGGTCMLYRCINTRYMMVGVGLIRGRYLPLHQFDGVFFRGCTIVLCVLYGIIYALF